MTENTLKAAHYRHRLPGTHTVADFLSINKKSILAEKLQARRLPKSKVIIVDSGIVSNAPQSKLQRIMKQTGWKNYVIGGRAGTYKTCGNWFAVYE